MTCQLSTLQYLEMRYLSLSCQQLLQLFCQSRTLVVCACQRAKLIRALSESFVTEEMVTEILLIGLGLVLDSLKSTSKSLLAKIGRNFCCYSTK